MSLIKLRTFQGFLRPVSGRNSNVYNDVDGVRNIQMKIGGSQLGLSSCAISNVHLQTVEQYYQINIISIKCAKLGFLEPLLTFGPRSGGLHRLGK